jgi:predicted ABC-type ATPase
VAEGPDGPAPERPVRIAPLVVVVNGAAGSGKTTLSLALAPHLGATVLSKDLIKEALYEPLGLDNDSASLSGSAAAIRLIYAIAATSASSLIVEANWKAIDVSQLTALGRPMVQLFCTAPPELLRERVLTRIRAGDRHPVHRDVIVPAVLANMLDIIERQECRPLDLQCPLLEVDTSGPVQAAALAHRILTCASSGSG